MPSDKRAVGLRICEQAKQLIAALGVHYGAASVGRPLSDQMTLETLARSAMRNELGSPTDAAFKRWHENAGITQQYTRRLSDEAIDAITQLAEAHSMSQSDIVEWLAFAGAQQHLPKA